MICNKCGSQIPDNAVECEFCGAKVDASAANGDTKALDSQELAAAGTGGVNVFDGNKEEIFDENEKKRNKQMEKMMEDKKKQLSDIERRRDAKRKKQKRKKIALIALICAAAAGAAGVGAHYIVREVTQNPKTTEQTLPVSSPAPAPSSVPVVTSPPVPSANPSSPSEAPVSGGTQGQNSSSTQSGQGSSTPSWTGTSSGSSSGRSSSASSSAGSSGGSSSASSSGKSSGGGSSSGGTSGSNGSTGASSASSGQSSQQNMQSFADIYAKASDSGIVSNKISSRLITGGEVIRNSATGKPLMTFIMDGVRYYAHVSEGSTTEQIKGKPFTVNADATSETYNGNTIYEISNMTKYDGDYILPESGTRLLNENDIKGLSKYDLALARNEIYARHGRKFQTAEYSTYFSSKPWYHIDPNYNYSDDDGNLNEIERENVMFILEAEK